MTGRTTVVVQRATDDDLELLERLVLAAAGGGAPPAPRLPSAGADHLSRLLARPDVEVHLAVAGEDPVGLLVLRLGEVVLPAPAPLLTVEQLWVDPAWRRRGLGHQLLSAVVGAAEAAGAEEVCVVSAPGERDVQRFLARLGFARPVVVRTAPLALLRARLAPPAAAAGGRDHRRAALDQLLARRRRQLGPGSGVSSRVARGVSRGERPAAGT